MNEIWKTITGCPGYEVSSFGRVKSLNYNKTGCEQILKNRVCTSGYFIVNIKGKSCFVHKLVAEAFIENKLNKKHVDHINTIKTDNRVDNLRWVTQNENCNNIITRKHMSDSSKGMKLSEETRKKISDARYQYLERQRSAVCS